MPNFDASSKLALRCFNYINSEIIIVINYMNTANFYIIIMLASLHITFIKSNILTSECVEIAKKLNISRSYVSRIEKRALTKLYLKLKE